MIKDLIERCLFSFDYLPLESNITQTVALAPHERQHTPKCLTRESITACFDLLLTAA